MAASAHGVDNKILTAMVCPAHPIAQKLFCFSAHTPAESSFAPPAGKFSLIISALYGHGSLKVITARSRQ